MWLIRRSRQLHGWLTVLLLAVFALTAAAAGMSSRMQEREVRRRREI